MKISAGGGIRTAELRVVRCLISAGQALNASERRRQERAPCWRGCPFAWPLYLEKETASRVINAQLAEVKTFAWPFLAACFQVLLKGFIGDCMRPSPAWFGGDHWI